MKSLIAAIVLFTTPVHADVWWESPSLFSYILDVGHGRVTMLSREEGGQPDIDCKVTRRLEGWSYLGCSDGQERSFRILPDGRLVFGELLWTRHDDPSCTDCLSPRTSF